MHHDHPAQIVNLDDKVPREAALADPDGFIAGLKTPVMIDEAQRGGPELLLAIKASVDSFPGWQPGDTPEALERSARRRDN